MSHRGSLLCLPDGIWAWPVAAPRRLTEAALALVFAAPKTCDFFILGTGAVPWILPERVADAVPRRPYLGSTR